MIDTNALPGPSLCEQLDKINSELKSVMNMIELPSIVKSPVKPPVKLPHSPLSSEAQHVLKGKPPIDCF